MLTEHRTPGRPLPIEAVYANPVLFKFFATKGALALHWFECCCLRLFERLDAAPT